MSTTFEAFRDEQAALIAALTPVSLADVSFRQHRDERDFREWATENPKTCFRRFAIRDLIEYDPPATSTYNEEWAIGRSEVLVAYPTDYRYGPQNLRDMRDVAREDEKYIDETIGAGATSSYTEGLCQLHLVDWEEGDAVSFLVLVYGFEFNRAR